MVGDLLNQPPYNVHHLSSSIFEKAWRGLDKVSPVPAHSRWSMGYDGISYIGMQPALAHPNLFCRRYRNIRARSKTNGAYPPWEMYLRKKFGERGGEVARFWQVKRV